MNIAPIKHSYTLIAKYNSHKKQPQFKGEMFPSGYYEDSEIETAKKLVEGAKTSEKKASASRENGKKGGRPRKSSNIITEG